MGDLERAETVTAVNMLARLPTYFTPMSCLIVTDDTQRYLPDAVGDIIEGKTIHVVGIDPSTAPRSMESSLPYTIFSTVKEAVTKHGKKYQLVIVCCDERDDNAIKSILGATLSKGGAALLHVPDDLKVTGYQSCRSFPSLTQKLFPLDEEIIRVTHVSDKGGR